MKKKSKGTEKELLEYLVKENILIHSEFAALKTVFKTLFIHLSQSDLHPDLKADLFETMYKQSLKNAIQQICATHPLFEDSWKSSIQEALSNVPGLNLS